MWKQDHLTTLTYHNKYIILMLYKIFHSFADNPLHTVPQALAIASELAISLRRWSNIDNWHAECGTARFVSDLGGNPKTGFLARGSDTTNLKFTSERLPNFCRERRNFH